MITTPEQLEKKLKQNLPKSIYLLYGEESFLLESCLKKIKRNFGELINGINYIQIYENNIDELIQNIETPAFGYENKLIIVKNSKIFERGGKNKSKEKEKTVDLINDYIKNNEDNIKENCLLIFVEDSVEKNKLYNTIEKIGIVCNFERLKPNQACARLNNICNAYKVKVSNADLNYLIESCGTNMQVLINEIRKLIEYAGENGTIKKIDIDNLCIKQMEAVIFDLTDNLGKKQIRKSLEILDNLIYSKEPIQKILVTLYNHFKKLYIIKIAIEQNEDIAESLKLKPNQMFLTSKYKTQSEYFTKEELRKIIQKLIDLDANYKQGLIDLNLGLKTILCENCSK